MIAALAFPILLLFTLASKERRKRMLSKSFGDWVLDLVNMPIQGIVVPVLQTLTFYGFLALLVPQFQKIWVLHPALAFLLNFVVVDYIYYWNHRLLHYKGFWNIHKVHHSVDDMDVLATSRNTVWTTFLIAYLWVNCFIIFLLKDPTAFMVAASLSAALDLWKHSNFPSARFISDKLQIATPIDHQWHHSSEPHSNYGANFNLWDKLHGTYRKEVEKPKTLGIKTELPLWRALFFPFKGKDS